VPLLPGRRQPEYRAETPGSGSRTPEAPPLRVEAATRFGRGFRCCGASYGAGGNRTHVQLGSTLRPSSSFPYRAPASRCLHQVVSPIQSRVSSPSSAAYWCWLGCVSQGVLGGEATDARHGCDHVLRTCGCPIQGWRGRPRPAAICSPFPSRRNQYGPLHHALYTTRKAGTRQDEHLPRRDAGSRNRTRALVVETPRSSTELPRPMRHAARDGHPPRMPP
jgi:hypothetical protein